MEISFTISSTIFKYNQKYFINSQYQPICNNISLTWLVHALINNSYWFSNFKVFKVWQRMKANRTNLKLLFNKSNSGFPMKMLMGLSRKWTKGSSLPKIPRLRVGGGGWYAWPKRGLYLENAVTHLVPTQKLLIRIKTRGRLLMNLINTSDLPSQLVENWLSLLKIVFWEEILNIIATF